MTLKNYFIKRIILLIVTIIIIVSIYTIKNVNNYDNNKNTNKIYRNTINQEFNYSIISNHSYKHLNEFNISNSTELNKILFEEECIQNINNNNQTNNNRERFRDLSNNRPIVYDINSNILTIGATDYKTIVTCYITDNKYVDGKVRNREWEQLR